MYGIYATSGSGLMIVNSRYGAKTAKLGGTTAKSQAQLLLTEIYRDAKKHGRYKEPLINSGTEAQLSGNCPALC